MPAIFLTLWPLFALILAGLVFRRSGFPGEGFWPAAEKLNYFVLFPALLFASLAKAPLADPTLLGFAAAILVVMVVAAIVLALLRRWRGWPAARYGPLVQGTIRFNTYLGLALVGSLYGTEGLARAAVVLAVLVPAVNVLSVIALTAERETSARQLLMPLVRNPLILACAAGAAFALTGVGLPFGTDRFLGLLAAASLPLGLLCVGAALKLAAARAETTTLLLNSAGRLVAMPLVAALVAWLFVLSPLDASLLVIFFALPTAPTAYVLTTQFKGDATLMAGLVTLQTLLAAASLPLVLSLFG
ncbi:AEC family transporter [Aurantimonas sp. C2-6-R+9]|uniref:AEC family transporter n=1 Tax=unclassified Aurantimonas TaxID=2638230 RepID=UPI002E1977E6|nr:MULTISPECIES: AEC family transporter [unclassified Aurantimonas]MEC5291764.1 AEC family transporter [Aurantimonas sp. C2-3-R2]MEC5381971.1 AEC family transporter [Aurantimonas sp. C2-6-R+9]MEC5412849.1 AEC family transporter [Aurantimonas sp. C2-4-R8]